MWNCPECGGVGTVTDWQAIKRSQTLAADTEEKSAEKICPLCSGLGEISWEEYEKWQQCQQRA